MQSSLESEKKLPETDQRPNQSSSSQFKNDNLKFYREELAHQIRSNAQNYIRYCEVDWCENSTANSSLAFFGIPKNPAREAEWRKNLNLKGNKWHHVHICSDHFHVNDFTSTLRRRLNQFAIPMAVRNKQEDLQQVALEIVTSSMPEVTEDSSSGDGLASISEYNSNIRMHEHSEDILDHIVEVQDIEEDHCYGVPCIPRAESSPEVTIVAPTDDPFLDGGILDMDNPNEVAEPASDTNRLVDSIESQFQENSLKDKVLHMSSTGSCSDNTVTNILLDDTCGAEYSYASTETIDCIQEAQSSIAMQNRKLKYMYKKNKILNKKINKLQSHLRNLGRKNQDSEETMGQQNSSNKFPKSPKKNESMKAIAFTNNPESEDIDFLTEMINKETSSEYGSASPFAFYIHDDSGKMIAGCNGSIVFGVIYTDQLWVHPDHRKKGLGGRLMDYVHVYGREQACKYSTVGTMSFQARTFYERLGYEVEFERNGYNGDSSYLYLKRVL